MERHNTGGDITVDSPSDLFWFSENRYHCKQVLEYQDPLPWSLGKIHHAQNTISRAHGLLACCRSCN